MKKRPTSKIERGEYLEETGELPVTLKLSNEDLSILQHMIGKDKTPPTLSGIAQIALDEYVGWMLDRHRLEHMGDLEIERVTRVFNLLRPGETLDFNFLFQFLKIPYSRSVQILEAMQTIQGKQIQERNSSVISDIEAQEFLSGVKNRASRAPTKKRRTEITPGQNKKVVTYTLGNENFDESFSLDAQNGDFLGEYGVGISETVGAGAPKKVTALEIWLFDKNDVRTTTLVLASEYITQDKALQARLVAKGKLVPISKQVQGTLKTQTLKIPFRVTDLKYKKDPSLPRNSYFEKVTLEFSLPVIASSAQQTGIAPLQPAKKHEGPISSPAAIQLSRPKAAADEQAKRSRKESDQAGSNDSKNGAGGRDDLLDQAIAIVRQHKTASVSLLQRQLRISHPHAKKLLDQLSKLGPPADAQVDQQKNGHQYGIQFSGTDPFFFKSFPIQDDNVVLGECGMTVCQTIRQKGTVYVTALELWLTDRTKQSTTSQILATESVWSHPARLAELQKKGKVASIEDAKIWILELGRLRLSVSMTDINFLPSEEQSHAYLQSAGLDFQVEVTQPANTTSMSLTKQLSDRTGKNKNAASSPDPLLSEAIELARKEGSVSVSMLQRRLRIGYTRAAHLASQMEELGIVGPPQGNAQTRRVL